MGLLKAIEKSLTNASRRYNSIMAESIKQYSPEIEDTITEEQLMKGKRGDGQTLPVYSKTSQQVYGKPNTPMTLKDEGDFHQGITTVVEKDKFFTEGKEEKTPLLETKYGASITDINKEKFNVLFDSVIKFDFFERFRKDLVDQIKLKR